MYMPRAYIYILNNNNKDDASCCTFAHYRRISRTHACPTIKYRLGCTFTYIFGAWWREERLRNLITRLLFLFVFI